LDRRRSEADFMGDVVGSPPIPAELEAVLSLCRFCPARRGEFMTPREVVNPPPVSRPDVAPVQICPYLSPAIAVAGVVLR
jgi:hypothetical protein